MPTYTYKVRDKQGRPITGDMDGADDNEITKSLRNMGYTTVDIKLKKPKKSILNIELFARVKFEDVVLFNRQMSTLLKAGLPLLLGLEAVSEQTSSHAFRDVILAIKTDVERGLSFSEALSKHKKIFSSIYTSMIRAGESSGLLDETMAKLADMGEYDIEAISKIKAAIRYPIIASVFLVGAFIGLVVGVVPSFEKVFNQFKVELPLPTRMLIGTKVIISDYWFLTILVLVSSVVVFIKFINTPFGRKRWDLFKLKVPVFGSLLLKMDMSRFAKTTSSLIASGVPMLEALDLVATVVGNSIISAGIRNIKEGVNKGSGLAEPMKISKLFTPMVIHMVAIGEETGKLDELLAKVAEHYDKQTDYAIKGLTALIEPMLILVLGTILLFVALALFLPLWNLISLFK
ncbi:MAG: type II secretion system F family protein [Candidatus Omnitrophota bacterium]